MIRNASLEPLCWRLLHTVHIIKVLLGNEVISVGSGFPMLPNGDLFTAAHVVTGCTPITMKDVNDPDIRIWAKTRNQPAALYRPAICGIDVVLNRFEETVQLDLAILRREEPQLPSVHLPIKVEAPTWGEEVLLAGYSDDVVLPFDLPPKPNMSEEELATLGVQSQQGIEADLQALMIKRGIVGNIRNLRFVSDERLVEEDVFIVDNAMHSGASGGPVVNLAGEIVGIITQRVLTSVSTSESVGSKAPAGTTLCLSLKPFLNLHLMETK